MKRVVAALLPCAFGAALLSHEAAAAPSHKLWIAWDSGTAGNKQNTIDFFNCILGTTDFNELCAAFPSGRNLSLGGTATISGCSSNDYQCIANAAGFSGIQAGDVLLHYWVGGGCVTGHNDWTVTVNGKAIHGAEAEVGTGADCQTALGMHEVYEACADADAADCCNGQNWSPLHANCHSDYGPSSADPYGWYKLSCGGKSYEAQKVSPNGNIDDAGGCEELSASCPGLHAACTQGGAACCSGYVCEAWSLSGQAPYSDFCCLAIGKACSANTDCCGGSNCESGHCACVPDGGWCINANECCGDDTCNLTAHKCEPKPSATTSSTAASSSSSGEATSAATGVGGGGPTASTATGAGAGGAGAHETGAKSGCGCEVAGARSSTAPAFGVALLAWLVTRRRAKRTSSQLRMRRRS